MSDKPTLVVFSEDVNGRPVAVNVVHIGSIAGGCDGTCILGTGGSVLADLSLSVPEVVDKLRNVCTVVHVSTRSNNKGGA